VGIIGTAAHISAAERLLAAEDALTSAQGQAAS
jgi:hypothetical protein